MEERIKELEIEVDRLNSEVAYLKDFVLVLEHRLGNLDGGGATWFPERYND